ncbi:MAG: sialate O-acetylesterase [Pricia sp.]
MEYVEEMPDPDKLWVFMMAGQSNMAGRGLVEPQDTVPNKRILTIDKTGRWIYAKEPLHFNEPSLTGLDSGMSFAKQLLDSISKEISIAMIPCAVGNTSVEQWLENDTYRDVTLFSNFEKNVALAKKYGKIKGILWHQGEANAKAGLIPQYGINIERLVAKMRTTVDDPSLVILMAQLGSFAEPAEWQQQWDSINAILKDYTTSHENTYLIYTQDLKSKDDHIHFDSESQRKMGKRYARKFLEVSKQNQKS